MVQHAVTWELEDARVELTDTKADETTTFWGANVRVDLDPRYCAGSRIPEDTDISGCIKLRHDIPVEVFFDDNGVPLKLDLEATVDGKTIEGGGLLARSDPYSGVQEFVAHSADFTEHADPEPDPDPDPQEDIDDQTTSMLARLIGGIADGDITVQSVTTSNDLKPFYKRGIPDGWLKGPKTLEVVYND